CSSSPSATRARNAPSSSSTRRRISFARPGSRLNLSSGRRADGGGGASGVRASRRARASASSNAFCRRSPGSSISSALRGAAPGRRVGAGVLRDLAVRTLLVRRAGFDLDHRGTRPAPPADDRLDLLVEHLWLLDRELATDRVVVEGARPPRRRDLEAGEVAARRAPV